MAAKSFDSWAYETFEKLGTSAEAIARLAWNAATEAAVERFASTNSVSPQDNMVQFTAEQLYGAAKDAGLHNADIDDLISVIGKQHTQAKMPSYGESINAIVAETGIKELNYRERKLTLAIHDYIARHIGC